MRLSRCVSVLEAADSGALCRAVRARQTGSRPGVGSASREAAAGAGPGSARRSCLGIAQRLRTRGYCRERSGTENTRVAISFTNESPKEREEPLLNQALLTLSTCDKCET